MSESPYIILASYILPSEIAENFDLTDVREEGTSSGNTVLHLYLDERAIVPGGRSDLKPNGFYEESLITDFPIRDHDTVLHVRRRRWKDADGTSHARDIRLDSCPVTARSLQRTYHIDGDGFERSYKNHLSGFRQWKDISHATDWLVFPRNIGASLSIDETSPADGELYTIVSNKETHGGKGSIVAIVKGTRVPDVVEALKRIMWLLRAKVTEVTMDLSESMRSIVWQCFPNAMVTLDKFHVQKDCYDALQAIRVRHRRETRLQDIEDREQHRYRRKHNASRRKQGKKDPRGRKPQRVNVRIRAAEIGQWGHTLRTACKKPIPAIRISGQMGRESEAQSQTPIRTLSGHQTGLWHLSLPEMPL